MSNFVDLFLGTLAITLGMGGGLIVLGAILFVFLGEA